MSANRSNWIPEILYEDDPNGLTSHLPFIPVPQDEEMPNMIFIFESRNTGEFEPGPAGEELPVSDLDLHQYLNFRFVAKVLGDDQVQILRDALGLPKR